jgi:hypothetical protein
VNSGAASGPLVRVPRTRPFFASNVPPVLTCPSNDRLLAADGFLPPPLRQVRAVASAVSV